MDHTRSLSHVLLQLWKLIHHLVSGFQSWEGQTANFISKGLQTPRLKRLAEIVSAQAMAQQEKLEIENGAPIAD